MSEDLKDIAQRMHSDLIDKDGIIEDLPIETFYFPAENIGQCDGYLRIIGDAGAYDFETRILNDALIYWGWTPPTKEFLDARQKKFDEEQARHLSAEAEATAIDMAAGMNDLPEIPPLEPITRKCVEVKVDG